MPRKGAPEDHTARLHMRATPTMKRTIEAFADGLGARLKRPVSMTEAVVIAVSSASAALASGQPVALAFEPGAVPEPGKERPG